MANSSSRFAWVVKLARLWAVSSLLLLATALIATGVTLMMTMLAGTTVDKMLWLIMAMVGEVAAGVGVVVICGVVETIVRGQQAAVSGAEHLRRVESVVDAIHESNRWLVDLAQMSDAAKSLLFREHETEAMDELLREALIAQDYAKAEDLVEDVRTRLGHADHGERMRKQIDAAKNTSMEQKVDAALEHVGAHIQAHNWTQALRQGQRLAKLVPGNPKVANLPKIIQDAQVRHKTQLLHDYGEAVKVSDIDRSIELIKELDKYLSPQEAAALEESARGVFRAKLHNLGVQFSIRVSEGAWADAIVAGEDITHEYPNSRMAQEVREKMDQLRARAAATAAAADTVVAAEPPAE